MRKRWLNVIQILVLVGIVAAYLLTTSDLLGRVYTPEQRQALAVQSRMHLSQVGLVSNYYLPSGDAITPQLLSSIGVTACRVRATLDARYEEIEGVTATVYDLDFEGTYQLHYDGPAPTSTIEVIFPFPQGLDTLNQVYFLVDGEEPPNVQYSLNNITWWTELETGEERDVVVRYRARGVGSFTYALDRNRRLENLDVAVVVRGLKGSQTSDDALPTTAVENVEDGERFAWRYEALIADRNVQVELPTRPGFAQRVEELQEPLHNLSLTSPLFVTLFVCCLVGVHRLSDVRLPFQHYVLAGLGFFLFYPALTFLSGVLELPLATAVALAIVTGLLVAFLGHAVGWRRTWLQTLLLSVVFLGLFSLGTMSQWRGLLITAGGLLLVGMFMLLIARRRPSQPVTKEPQESSEDDVEEAEPVESQAPSRYCPHCGASLGETFAFCPACGHDAKLFRRCLACGAEHYVSPEAELGHCPGCGERMSE